MNFKGFWNKVIFLTDTSVILIYTWQAKDWGLVVPIIPALGKLRQVCYELVSSLGYRKTLSPKKKNNQGSTHKGIYL